MALMAEQAAPSPKVVVLPKVMGDQPATGIPASLVVQLSSRGVIAVGLATIRPKLVAALPPDKKLTDLSPEALVALVHSVEPTCEIVLLIANDSVVHSEKSDPKGDPRMPTKILVCHVTFDFELYEASTCKKIDRDTSVGEAQAPVTIVGDKQQDAEMEALVRAKNEIAAIAKSVAGPARRVVDLLSPPTVLQITNVKGDEISASLKSGTPPAVGVGLAIFRPASAPVKDGEELEEQKVGSCVVTKSGDKEAILKLLTGEARIGDIIRVEK